MNEFICSRCDICTINNHHPMRGDGCLSADIMFVTRNPSSSEIKKDIPLFDKEGLLFQDYLELFNFHRDDIYITNAVKCKTPKHRLPTDNEVNNCRSHLENEIELVKPKIIVLMGNTALRSYFKLAFRNIDLDISTLNSKYLFKDNRVILFTIEPYLGLKSRDARIALFNSFISLLKLYWAINPAHKVNFNL